MSENHSEYMRYKRLLESKFIKLSFFKDVLLNLAKARLEKDKEYLAVIDGSEIRKPSSKSMEKLQGVRALDGKIVRGYRSTGTVILSTDCSEVLLLDQEVFSSKEDRYYSDNDYGIKAIKQVNKLKGFDITFVLR
ncbi:MAG: hypothetical protein ACRCXZ_09550 [Patescibacteria group bacterium]